MRCYGGHARPSSPLKEQRRSIRASEPEKAIPRRAAQARNMNTSQFVLEASLDAAQSLLVDHSQFRLPPEQWEAFCRRIDEPPRTIPVHRRLFNEPDPHDVAT